MPSGWTAMGASGRGARSTASGLVVTPRGGMVSGVPRSEHGWSRISVYGAKTRDYDLCAVHTNAIGDVLGP